MSASIVEALTSLMTPAMRSALASQLDETEPSATRALRSAFGAIFGTMLARVDDKPLLADLTGLINGGEFALPPPDELSALPRMSSDAGPTSSPGASMLQLLFDGRIGAADDAVALESGITAKSARSMLALAAPFVLAQLRKSGPAEGFDAQSLAQFLMSQREHIEPAIPSGLTPVTPIGRYVRDTRAPERTSSDQDAQVLVTTARTAPPRSRWARPLLVVATAAALLAVFWPRSTTNVMPPGLADSAEVMAINAPSVVDSAAGTIEGTPAPMAARVRRMLPGGRELNVAEGSIEARLTSVLADSASQAPDSTWLTFDRLAFEAGSAVLAASSSSQLDNIADILRAYPDARVQIGGYTDNLGDPEANHELSDGRAEAVKAALVLRGVFARRISAEGYGGLFPVASNNTEEGRRRNQRVALRLTDL